jgi:hypothetical protein
MMKKVGGRSALTIFVLDKYCNDVIVKNPASLDTGEKTQLRHHINKTKKLKKLKSTWKKIKILITHYLYDIQLGGECREQAGEGRYKPQWFTGFME